MRTDIQQAPLKMSKYLIYFISQPYTLRSFFLNLYLKFITSTIQLVNKKSSMISDINLVMKICMSVTRALQQNNRQKQFYDAQNRDVNRRIQPSNS